MQCKNQKTTKWLAQVEVSQVSEKLVKLIIHDVSSCLLKPNLSLKGKVVFIFLLVVTFIFC